MQKWKCTKCGKRIKKGVLDRVNELASYDSPRHPSHRPSYLYLIPLAEIIKKTLGHSSTNTKKVKGAWEDLIFRFGSEVNVLVDTKMDDIAGATDQEISDSIGAFREGRIQFHPGGGGQYGSLEILDPKTFAKLQKVGKKTRSGQMNLFEY
jgi:uncharacterized protein (TIGR00375 family)